MEMHIFRASMSYSMPLNLEARASNFQMSPFDQHIMAPIHLEDHLEL